ncbi:MAG: riboflavin biosynthesis protein RibF [Candidatus Symbiothrix sp.]|jgi:riboflavin kinase/FMN adenylyltransferase|nr:riboflavin biosynthesis protein RibF [Candidatus Symbiothrix sp.]
MEIINHYDAHCMQTEIAATIGFFDGVHAGHRFLIEQLKALANGLPSHAITFWQHPQITLQNGYNPFLLTTLDEKLYQLSTTGIDYCLLMDFTQSLSELSAGDFIRNVLRKQLQVRTLLIGYDHRFGKNRTESFPDYVRYGKECGMDVLQAMELPDATVHISSTQIRNSLSKKQIAEANRMLSYSYTLHGKVIPGNQLGRQIGFPTANLEVEKTKMIPGEGIYAVWVYWENNQLPGMAYIGYRPSVSSFGERRIEVHLLDFSGDLYGKTLRLEFIKFLRDDQYFGSLEELSRQLSLDKENTVKALR